MVGNNMKMISINRLIRTKDSFLFGPFIGEFGWELMWWAGFVRGVKDRYPEKKVYVSTRKSSKDIYYGPLVDGIHTFSIEGDYDKFRPGCYYLFDFPDIKFQELIVESKLYFNQPTAYHIHPLEIGCVEGHFAINTNYNFTPHQDNYKIIRNAINDRNYEDRTIVTLCPRHRNDCGQERNFSFDFWDGLFDILGNDKSLCVLVIGRSPSIYKPEYPENFIVLEDLPETENTSISGLTIEAIKMSHLSVNPQTSIVILCNVLKKPNIFWGNNPRVAVKMNPTRTYCRYIKEEDAKPDLIASEFYKILEVARTRPERLSRLK